MWLNREVNWKLVSNIAFLALLGCVVALFATGSLFASGPVTITVQIAAAVLMFWARITFGIRSFHAAANPTAGGLVTRGPYKYLRHPIYAAILYFVWAGVAAHLSVRNVLIGFVATVMLGLRMYSEERLLGLTYPEYAEYSRKTARVLPMIL